jgi:hypothetical protein
MSRLHAAASETTNQLFSWQSTRLPTLLVSVANFSAHACELAGADNLGKSGSIELLWNGVLLRQNAASTLS